MTRALSFCGVILAAGESSRMGSDKALLPWPPAPAGKTTNRTFLSAAIERLSSFSDMVIVVAGHNEPKLTPVIYSNGGFVARNPAPERGQFSSLQIGLQEVLNHGRDAAIVTLVDRPPAKAETVEMLRESLMSAAPETWAVVPEYKGKHGHPILFDRAMIHAFLNAPVAANAREIEHQHQQHIAYVAVDDPFVTLNVNTPEEYAALTTQLG